MASEGSQLGNAGWTIGNGQYWVKTTSGGDVARWALRDYSELWLLADPSSSWIWQITDAEIVLVAKMSK
jgi:hypothetical protein